MNSAEIAEYLEGGAAALASGELTWVQNSSGTVTFMTACALGACNYAKFGEMYSGSGIPDGYESIKRASEKAVGVSLVTYNDTPSRTVDEVVELLTHLAKDFRNA